MNIVDYADLYAERAHRGQLRKYTGEPFIEHPRRVAKMILETGGILTPHLFHPSEVAAALLHDVIEDCGVSPVQLERDFGTGVCGVVMDLTNPPKDVYPNLSRRERKALDRERLGAATWVVQSIKCADRIDNLTDSMCFADPGFLRLYLEESRLLHGVLTRAVDSLRDRLITTIQRLEQGETLCNDNRQAAL